jgi:hypothetical protein
MEESEFVEYAANQFDRRTKGLERDRGKSFIEMEQSVISELEAAETAVVA